MLTELKNVFVDKISLVSKKENPAVPKASTKFALFKTKSKKSNEHTCDVSIKKLEDSDYMDLAMWWYVNWKYYTYNEYNDMINQKIEKTIDRLNEMTL